MENTLFLGDFPIETIIHRGFSIAMFGYQRVPAGVSLSTSIAGATRTSEVGKHPSATGLLHRRGEHRWQRCLQPPGGEPRFHFAGQGEVRVIPCHSSIIIRG